MCFNITEDEISTHFTVQLGNQMNREVTFHVPSGFPFNPQGVHKVHRRLCEQCYSCCLCFCTQSRVSSINWTLCGSEKITGAPQQLECGNMNLKHLGSQTNNVEWQSFKEDIISLLDKELGKFHFLESENNLKKTQPGVLPLWLYSLVVTALPQ